MPTISHAPFSEQVDQKQDPSYCRQAIQGTGERRKTRLTYDLLSLILEHKCCIYFSYIKCEHEFEQTQIGSHMSCCHCEYSYWYLM